MSFLGKARKEDLKCLAEELGEEATHDLKVIDLKGLITSSKNYDEEFVKGLMETIIETRQENERKLLREEAERIESEKEQQQLEKQREEREFEKSLREFELAKLRIEKSHIEESKDVVGGKAQNYCIEFSKLMQKFNPKEDDIILYLSIFERQAKRVRVDPKHWVSSLLTLLPLDIIQILARESEENFEDYEYMKTMKKELRSLIGLASYYRECISNFSSLVLPLTNLTRKNVPNVIPWNAEAENAFKKLKEEIANMTSMFTPKLDKPFQLYTDASANAVGACLAQRDEKDQDRPIAFFSKKLTETQMRWSTIEREAYSVIEALKKFDTWIFGAEVEVISDHNPLTYLTCSVPHGAKLARWSLALQRYNLNITYRKGSRHSNADSMSRLKFED